LPADLFDLIVGRPGGKQRFSGHGRKGKSSNCSTKEEGGSFHNHIVFVNFRFHLRQRFDWLPTLVLPRSVQKPAKYFSGLIGCYYCPIAKPLITITLL